MTSKLLKLLRRRQKERRLLRNRDKREAHDRDYAVTDPTAKAAMTERASAAITRADEIAQIATVVMIRTNPDKASPNQ